MRWRDNWRVAAEALLPLILIASLSGLIVAVVLMAAGRKTRKDAIPFGPYLSLAAWVLSLYGPDLYAWYFSIWRP
ncbi:MAG: prepilin peptidase [Hydrogenibacillus sp.]|nr:prepilin peptidase [Hydrogenibacillus sp.]